MTIINSRYIHEDKILSGIYSDAVKKFMHKAGEDICFIDVAKYIFAKLVQKRQSVYEHSIMIVKEVCQKIGEDFYQAVGYYAPDAKCYRDIYYSIYG